MFTKTGIEKEHDFTAGNVAIVGRGKGANRWTAVGMGSGTDPSKNGRLRNCCWTHLGMPMQKSVRSAAKSSVRTGVWHCFLETAARIRNGSGH